MAVATAPLSGTVWPRPGPRLSGEFQNLEVFGEVCPGERPRTLWRCGCLASSPKRLRLASFCRWCLDTALSRPVTALDNERFTVQSVMLHYAVPVVLVREWPQGRGQRGPDVGELRGPARCERAHVGGSE